MADPTGGRGGGERARRALDATQRDPRPQAPIVQSGGSATYNTPVLGKRLGRYELLSELGRGGMGVVYRARDSELGREVALKLLLGGLTLDARDLERFRREARLASRVNHVGIVTVLDAGTIGEVPFVTMTLVQGSPLSKVPLGLEDFVRVLAKSARAIGAAHRAGVVHRDLKPTNILVDPDTREPVVVDFGLAFDARLEMTRLSKTNEIVGTPAWMAPETVAGKAKPDDPRLDVYALGLMLYEKLAGHNPLLGATHDQTFERVARGAPPLPRGVDPVLGDLAQRAVALDATRRPPNGDAFAESLESWLAGESAPTARRSIVPIVAAACVVAATVGGAVTMMILLSGRETKPSAPVATAPVQAPAPPPKPEPKPEEPRPTVFAPGVVVARPARGEPMPADVAASIAADVQTAFIGGGPMDDDDERRMQAARTRVIARAPELARRHPTDGRAVLVGAFARAWLDGEEHGARRDMVASTRLEPEPAPWQLDIAGRYSHALGFERAAADLGELAFREGRVPPPDRGVWLAQLYLKARPPVADPRRAEAICDKLLLAKTAENSDRYPETWMLHSHRADARIGLNDAEGAVARIEQALAATNDTRLRAFLGEAIDRIRNGQVGPDDMGVTIMLNFATTDFLVRLSREGGWGHGGRRGRDHDPERREHHLAELEALAGQETRAKRTEHAALVWLKLAGAHARARDKARAIAALEKAVALPLDGAPDTWALVRRALARALLEEGSDSARAELVAREAAAPVPDGAFDPRTSGELAEAWVLVARARRDRGDGAGAREALGRALLLEPLDHREADEVGRRLGQ